MINSSQSDLNSEIMESTTESSNEEFGIIEEKMENLLILDEPPNHFEVSTRSSILSSRSQESSAEAIGKLIYFQ